MMPYEIATIPDKNKIHLSPMFFVNHFYGNHPYQPLTYGHLGWIQKQGLYLKMTCEENPDGPEFTKINEPVYKDSAMEAFFKFDIKSSDYFNFEMNSHGALLAQYGPTRNGRIFLTMDQLKLLEYGCAVHDDYWTMELLLTLDFIRQFYPSFDFNARHIFLFNFYKIQESGEKEHYASCYPLSGLQPDFHRPEDFSRGIIV